MKLWQKDATVNNMVEQFTVGNDREMDLYLAPYDVLGSLAHITMLESIGLLTSDELKVLRRELVNIYNEISKGDFRLGDDVEDIHSQIELLLTERLGNIGKKVHSARSRNDQVLVDLKLFLRSEIEQTVHTTQELFEVLQQKSAEFSGVLLPGYTHLQLAMPSSFGLWLGAYAEGLVDDAILMKSAYDIVNKNPLGSAAGYGSSFPINRTLTTQLLGFADLNYNVVYAQMGRGKAERVTASALANIADTIARLAMDACLYMNQNFGFISFPEELTTGSSIMPHKKNPDVFELIRAKCNHLKALPNEITLATTNLPSGYHRDLQLLKEHLFPAFTTLRSCMEMTGMMLRSMQVKRDILEEEKYKYIFSVEEVNKLVLQGVPFRDAYKQVGTAIQNGTYTYSTTLQHTHEGSIGDLGLELLQQRMNAVVESYNFSTFHAAYSALLATA